MAKKHTKKKTSKKSSSGRVMYTPFAIDNRLIDLTKVEGKANRTTFELQTHGMILGLDFLRQDKLGNINRKRETRIGLQPYKGQYIGAYGRICDVRESAKGISILLVNPALLGTYGVRPKSEVLALIKEADGSPEKGFQMIKNQPTFSSHIWVYLPNIDLSVSKEKALYLGSIVLFYAKVEEYKGKVSTSHLKGAVKYGFGDIILDSACVPYMSRVMSDSGFKASRSGLQVQTMYGKIRRKSTAEFDETFALAVSEDGVFIPNIEWFKELKSLSLEDQVDWMRNYVIERDIEVRKAVRHYLNMCYFIKKVDPEGIPMMEELKKTLDSKGISY